MLTITSDVFYPVHSSPGTNPIVPSSKRSTRLRLLTVHRVGKRFRHSSSYDIGNLLPKGLFFILLPFFSATRSNFTRSSRNLSRLPNFHKFFTYFLLLPPLIFCDCKIFSRCRFFQPSQLSSAHRHLHLRFTHAKNNEIYLFAPSNSCSHFFFTGCLIHTMLHFCSLNSLQRDVIGSSYSSQICSTLSLTIACFLLLDSAVMTPEKLFLGKSFGPREEKMAKLNDFPPSN